MPTHSDMRRFKIVEGGRTNQRDSGDLEKEQARREKDVERSVLMARAQEGDQKSYRLLLEDITPYVRAIAARRLMNAADAEEAVQDVLLTIHTVRHTYDPRRPFAPWLATIANRRCIDVARRVMRTQGRQTELDVVQETFAAPGANIEEALADSDTISKALEELPRAQKEAVKLLKMKEMTLKEASAASGMSVPALKVAMHRALKTLRRVIGDEGDLT